MNNLRRWLATAILASGSFVGCASLDPRPSFDRVREDARGRIGQDLRWNQGLADDAEVQARIRQMLQGDLTPDQAVQIALLNNRRLQAAYEQLGVAQAQLVQAGLLRNPVFSGSFRLLSGGGGTGVLEMQVEQDFLDVLLIPMKKRLADAELRRARLRVTAAVMDLAHRVRVSFVSMQWSRQVVAVQQMSVAAAEASYDVAQRLRRAGSITNLELAERRAQYEQAKLELTVAEAGALAAHERLNALLGLWGDDTAWHATAALPDVPDDDPSLDDVESRVVGCSLDLALARQEVELAAASVGLDVAAAFQNVSLGGHAERDPGGFWQVGPTVTVPVPLFDLGQAAAAAGNARLRQQWNEYVALAVEVRAAARTARQRLTDARRLALYCRTVMVPLRQQITAETLLQYNAMQVGVFDLLLAKQQEIDADGRALEALRDYWIARANLELMLKGRTPATVLEAVAGAD
jgi:cobalt-zinc-cadmium efflux system outer membrane protein